MVKRKGQMDKQRSTKLFTENKTSSNRNHTKKQEWTRVLRKVQKYLFHQWHPSCYSSYKLPLESFEYLEYINYHIKLRFLFMYFYWCIGCILLPLLWTGCIN